MASNPLTGALRAAVATGALAVLVAGAPGGNTVLWTSPVGSPPVSPDVAAKVQGIPPVFMTSTYAFENIAQGQRRFLERPGQGLAALAGITHDSSFRAQRVLPP